MAPWRDYPEMVHLFGAYYWCWAKRGFVSLHGGRIYRYNGNVEADTRYNFRRVLGPLFVLEFEP